MSWWNKNLLTRLFRHTASSRRPATTRFRPALLPLEDRTVPAGADLFANATALTGVYAADTGSNVGATVEAGEPAILGIPANKSVWWKWTAPASGSVEVNTFGSSFDTLVGVYTGSFGSLTAVAESDDANSPQSQALFDAVAGTTYYIAVDGYPGSFFGDEGNVRLQLGMTPANDDFANAISLTGGTATGHNLATTGETGEPADVASGNVNTVWWTWTAATGGAAEINTFGSNFDTRLAVYRDSTPDTPPSFGDLVLVVFNDDADDPNNGTALDLQSQALFNAVAGETYYIAVDGFQSETGSIQLTAPDAPSTGNNPPTIAPQTFSVNENSVGGTVVGTVAASDPDAGQSVTYSIVGGNTGNAFTINFTTGVIQVSGGFPLNFETNPTFTLTVQVTDSGSPALSSSATVTINLNDVNEKPTLSPYTFTVAENSASGTAVGTVAGSDVDAGQTLTYSITGGNASGAFAINPATGQITVANPAALDYETTQSFALVVTVTDSGSPALAASATVTVNLTDVDDTSPTYYLGQLSNQVTALLNGGYLTSSQAGNLRAKLNNISEKLAQGNVNAALNNLNAFKNQVMGLVNQGYLTPAQGQALLDVAEALRLAIGG